MCSNYLLADNRCRWAGLQKIHHGWLQIACAVCHLLQWPVHMESLVGLYYICSLLVCFHHKHVWHWSSWPVSSKKVSVMYGHSMVSCSDDGLTHDVMHDNWPDLDGLDASILESIHSWTGWWSKNITFLLTVPIVSLQNYLWLVVVDGRIHARLSLWHDLSVH